MSKTQKTGTGKKSERPGTLKHNGKDREALKLLRKYFAMRIAQHSGYSGW